MATVTSATNYFPKAQEGFTTTLNGTIAPGATSLVLNSTAGYSVGDVVVLVIDPALSTKQVFTGVVATGNAINSVVWTEGTNAGHTTGATVVDYTTATHWDLFQAGILKFATQAGALSPTAVRTALGQTSATGAGWTTLSALPSTVTANGNRSYSMVFNTTDLTGTLSPGMRLMTQRTVAAPTQCTSLNGSTQYYSKTAPAGMTFTDNFTASAWIKLSNYTASADMGIISRFNGTSGWILHLTSTGQVKIFGQSSAGVNRAALSYQSVPLNKWVHVAATLTLSTGTANIYIDGVLVPSAVSGTATAVVQAGNLEVGSYNASNFFPGKIAQAAIFSAVLSQATIQSYISQGLAGTETSLISAYSFNNSINDLNANANNLTANGSAVATNPDSPFGGQANGTISSTLDYGIVTAATFSTNTTLTVQVPEGCTIPTSGGVSAVSYATVKAPYGMPVQRGKWSVLLVDKQNESTGSTSAGTFNPSGLNIQIPVGEWRINAKGSLYINVGTVGFKTLTFQFGTSATTNGLLDSQATFYFNPSASSDQMAPFTTFTNYSSTVLAPLYIQLVVALGGTLSSAPGIRGDNATTVIEAELAYL